MADFTISQGLGFNEDRRYFESDNMLKGLVDPTTEQTPHYNNVLGIFNILETPRFKYNHLPLGQASANQ